MNKQQQANALELTKTLGTSGCNAFYWRQIFTLDSVVAKA